jgi:TolB-like protein/Tfp pilus assembly protein PilF
MRALALVSLGAALSACARSVSTPPVAPGGIPALEAARQQRPGDIALLTQLGIAYYDAKDFSHARDVLKSALALQSRSFTAAVYLGLTYEELGVLDSARASYVQAEAMSPSSAQRSELNDRLALLTRKELQQDARVALSQEAALASAPPTENTIAVFPFRYRGANEELRPLERGLSHLIVTDLSKVSQLRLLERERVQVLIDEMRLADSGRVEPATGARSGRMLRAAKVVQGSLQDQPSQDRLRLDANVVDATNSSVTATGAATDRLQQLFEVEKLVVFQLLDRMRINLSPAERRAISERPTADLQAFLAFSRGLEAEDRGDFAAAAEQFNAAVARDPNFRTARDRRAQNQRLAGAVTITPSQLAGIDQGIQVGAVERPTTTNPNASTPRVITLRNVITGAVPSHGGLIDRQVGANHPPIVRPPLPEALQQDDPRTPGLTGQIIIIITRP